MNPTIQFEKLRAIGEQLRTQDNLATSEPLFIVEQKRRDYGFSSNWSDSPVVWLDEEGNEHALDSEEGKKLEKLLREAASFEEVPKGWTRTHYKDRWEFVTACFTRKGCEDYIAANGHNLKSPRIYVASAHRNAEWNAVRGYLLTH